MRRHSSKKSPGTKRRQPTATQNSQINRLFVGGMEPSTSERDLYHYFGQFGPIAEAEVIRDKVSGISKGYGFIKCGDQGTSLKILKSKHQLNGRKVDVNRAVEKWEADSTKKEISDRKLFIRGIKYFLSDDDLIEYFSKFGDVKNAYAIRDPVTQVPKNFGYVEFFDKSSVTTTLKHASEHFIKGAKIQCSRYRSKDSQESPRKLKQGSHWKQHNGYNKNQSNNKINNNNRNRAAAGPHMSHSQQNGGFRSRGSFEEGGLRLSPDRSQQPNNKQNYYDPARRDLHRTSTPEEKNLPAGGEMSYRFPQAGSALNERLTPQGFSYDGYNHPPSGSHPNQSVGDGCQLLRHPFSFETMPSQGRDGNSPRKASYPDVRLGFLSANRQPRRERLTSIQNYDLPSSQTRFQANRGFPQTHSQAKLPSTSIAEFSEILIFECLPERGQRREISQWDNQDLVLKTPGHQNQNYQYWTEKKQSRGQIDFSSGNQKNGFRNSLLELNGDSSSFPSNSNESPIDTEEVVNRKCSIGGQTPFGYEFENLRFSYAKNWMKKTKSAQEFEALSQKLSQSPNKQVSKLWTEAILKKGGELYYPGQRSMGHLGGQNWDQFFHSKPVLSRGLDSGFGDRFQTLAQAPYPRNQGFEGESF